MKRPRTKAQVNIEFIISVLLFLFTVATLSFNIIGDLPRYHQESAANILRSQVGQISSYMIISTGYPANWETLSIGGIKAIGLSSGTEYYLSQAKLDKLSTLCESNYEDVKNILGMDYRMNILINITKTDGTVVASCLPKVIAAAAPKYWIHRTAILGSDVVKVDVGAY